MRRRLSCTENHPHKYSNYLLWHRSRFANVKLGNEAKSRPYATRVWAKQLFNASDLSYSYEGGRKQIFHNYIFIVHWIHNQTIINLLFVKWRESRNTRWLDKEKSSSLAAKSWIDLPPFAKWRHICQNRRPLANCLTPNTRKNRSWFGTVLFWKLS